MPTVSGRSSKDSVFFWNRYFFDAFDLGLTNIKLGGYCMVKHEEKRLYYSKWSCAGKT